MNKDNFKWTESLVKEFAAFTRRRGYISSDYVIELDIEAFKSSHASLGVQNEKWVVGENVEFDALLLKEDGMGVASLRVTGQILAITYYNEMAEVFFTHPFSQKSIRTSMEFKNLRKPQPLPKRTKLFIDHFGNDVFVGDRVWWVVIHYGTDYTINTDIMKSTSSFNHNRVFLSEDAAKEYITLNKPCLSAADIFALWSLEDGPRKMVIELAKKKLGEE